jgi:hypothetical protein
MYRCKRDKIQFIAIMEFIFAAHKVNVSSFTNSTSNSTRGRLRQNGVIIQHTMDSGVHGTLKPFS